MLTVSSSFRKKLKSQYKAKCHALEILDDVVFAYFAVEMVIKMIAMGVWGKLGYLGDSWNRLGT